MQTISRVRVKLLPYDHYQLRSKLSINTYKTSNYNLKKKEDETNYTSNKTSAYQQQIRPDLAA